MHGREFEIIERYFGDAVFHDSEQVLLGPGDDCAILRPPAGKDLCVSTDTLVTGVHFPIDATGTVVAHRALVANLSDLAAMGAECLGFALALTLPREDPLWLEAFSTRLATLARQYAIPLVGGNLARGELSVTITVLGTLPRGMSLRRGGASQGDDVYVSGTLGDAAGGLRLLTRDGQPQSYLVERYRYPKPQLALGTALLGIASAAIDISDGLAADLGHICENSRMGAEITVDLVPLSQPLIGCFNQVEAQRLAVSAGDDYELCFTAATRQRDEIARISRQLAVPVSRIGRIVPGEGVRFFDAGGMPRQFAEHGYQHFHEA